MFDRTLFKTNALAVSVAILSVVSLSSCSKNAGTTTAVTPQGTVSLDSVRVGMPEATFKDATITFIVDSKPAASGQGKTQYLSRTYDKKGGQYIAQVKGGKCFALQALYKTTPLTKEEALEELKNLLPTDAPPQSKTDDSQVKAGKGELVEYGTQYTGLLQYAAGDKTNSKVEAVTAFDLAPDAVREGLNWTGKAPKGAAPAGAEKGGKAAKKAEKGEPAAEKTEAPAAETSTSTATTETTTSTSTTP